MVDNFIRRERFAQKSGDPGAHQTIEAVAANETGTKNNRDVRSNFAEAMECFLAVHKGHGQIEQDQLKRMRLTAEKIERFKSGLCGHDLVARFA